MRSRLLALVAAIFALVVTSIGIPGSATAVPGTAAAVAHTYAAHDAAAAPTDTVTERGPSAGYDPGTTYNAVGSWSLGVSTRPDGPTPTATFRYTTPQTFVHAARATTTTGMQGEVTDGALLGLSGAMVAANTVRTFGTLSEDELLQAGLRTDRNGLTGVGRALQKHANRPNSAYPQVAGRDLNASGQQVLERILRDPRTAVQTYKHPNPLTVVASWT